MNDNVVITELKRQLNISDKENAFLKNKILDLKNDIKFKEKVIKGLSKND